MTDIERIRALCQCYIEEAARQVDEAGEAGAIEAVTRGRACAAIIREIAMLPAPTSPERIPVPIREALDRYAQHGVRTGDCMRSVLENDLMQAFDRADVETGAAMPAILAYVRCQLPGDCWGSPEIVSRWLSRPRA